MPNSYRVAVLGTGMIGHEHIHGFQQSPHADVVAVADQNIQRLKGAANKFGIGDLYLDYRDVLRCKNIEAVSIALPNYLHRTAALQALAAGKHVMLDKPMATSAVEAAQILAAARRARKILMVGQNMRFSPDTQRLKKAIQQGRLGRIYHARAYWLRRSGIPRIGSWFTRKQFAGGGACYDIGVHLLDLTLHLMGQFDVVSVSGSVSGHLGSKGIGNGTWGRSEIDPRKIFDVDDHARALLKLKNGSTIDLEVAWASFQEKEDVHGIELYGDKAGAHWLPAKIFRPHPNGFLIEQLQSGKLRYPTDRMVHFMECVALGKRPLIPPEESLHIQKVLDAIYMSSTMRREIRLR